MSETTITVRTRPNGAPHQILSDGSSRELPPASPMREMTEAEIHAAALADPDSHPLTPENLANFRPVPLAKTLRRKLGLTQEEFAARYQIPLGTLRDWEQARATPDQTAIAYLKAIAGDPHAVTLALQAAPANPAATVNLAQSKVPGRAA